MQQGDLLIERELLQDEVGAIFGRELGVHPWAVNFRGCGLNREGGALGGDDTRSKDGEGGNEKKDGAGI